MLTDILCDNTAVWSYEWNYKEKCADSFTVCYDQGDKPKNILLFLVVFNIHVFSFMVQKKLLMILKIHLKKWTVLNTDGSYNRTCKGNYVRPLQPYKDVNANLTKTNISPLTAQVSRDTQETVVKRNFMLTYI